MFGSRGTHSEMEVALARQRSFVGAAFAVFVLYWICYLPGLIFNLMWLSEAGKVRRVAGSAPAGLGCLQAMLVIGFLPPVLLAIGLAMYPAMPNRAMEGLKQVRINAIDASSSSAESTGPDSPKHDDGQASSAGDWSQTSQTRLEETPVVVGDRRATVLEEQPRQGYPHPQDAESTRALAVSHEEQEAVSDESTTVPPPPFTLTFERLDVAQWQNDTSLRDHVQAPDDYGQLHVNFFIRQPRFRKVGQVVNLYLEAPNGEVFEDQCHHFGWFFREKPISESNPIVGKPGEAFVVNLVFVCPTSMEYVTLHLIGSEGEREAHRLRLTAQSDLGKRLGRPIDNQSIVPGDERGPTIRVR